jgi:hypothetical protein
VPVHDAGDGRRSVELLRTELLVGHPAGSLGDRSVEVDDLRDALRAGELGMALDVGDEPPHQLRVGVNVDRLLDLDQRLHDLSFRTPPPP